MGPPEAVIATFTMRIMTPTCLKLDVPHGAVPRVLSVKVNRTSSFRLQVLCVILDFKGRKNNLAR